jgi:hypothetical protein
MSKQEIIEQTVLLLEQLPEEKATEIRDFAAFLVQRKAQQPPVLTEMPQETVVSRQPRQPQATPELETAPSSHTEDATLAQQVATYVEQSSVFAFLHDPAEDVYTLADLKVRYR